jgi:hypothetical protein
MLGKWRKLSMSLVLQFFEMIMPLWSKMQFSQMVQSVSTDLQ